MLYAVGRGSLTIEDSTFIIDDARGDGYPSLSAAEGTLTSSLLEERQEEEEDVLRRRVVYAGMDTPLLATGNSFIFSPESSAVAAVASDDDYSTAGVVVTHNDNDPVSSNMLMSSPPSLSSYPPPATYLRRSVYANNVPRYPRATAAQAVPASSSADTTPKTTNSVPSSPASLYNDDTRTATATTTKTNATSSLDGIIELTTCDDLKVAIEAAAAAAAGGGGQLGNSTCTFYLANSVTCDSAITIASGQDVTVTGSKVTAADIATAEPSSLYSWILPTSHFTANQETLTTSEQEEKEEEAAAAAAAAKGASLFVVEPGGRLTLRTLGFGGAEVLTSAVRAVHNYGDLYVSFCVLEGRLSGDAAVGEQVFGGAVSVCVLVCFFALSRACGSLRGKGGARFISHSRVYPSARVNIKKGGLEQRWT